MTDGEQERRRAAKKAVTARLAALDIGGYRLGEVDSRLDVYTREVADNPDRHNLWEQLAVERFFRMIDRYGLNRVEVLRIFTFYEFLFFPGKRGLQRYRLTPVQAFQFASVYGFWEGRHRVVRECVLYVPRKFSKTTGSATFALYDLLYGDANAESYTGANSQDQAKKCFDVIRGCMRKLDPDSRRYIINQQVVRPTRNNQRPAFAQCLTANARTKDGLNASTVIMDEFSQARNSELLTVLTTSMGVRDNPLTVIITTASDVFDGPFFGMLNGYKEVLLGTYEDDSVFAHLFEPDIGDDEGDENTWRKVHPHIDVTVSLNFYHAEYLKAQRNGAESMLAFRTKLLNVYAENEQKSWVSASTVRKAQRPVRPELFTTRPDAMMAIDLSESDDFSAVTVAIYEKGGAMFHFHTRYFFPRGALADHPNRQLYEGWAADGHLTLTDGDVIDYGAVVDYMLEVNRYVRILKVGYDPYKSTQLVNDFGASAKGARDVLCPVRQTYGTFTAPCEFFEHQIKTGRLVIDDNPINAYCFGNAVLDFDHNENMKPVKRSRFQKIDGVITKLMCLRLFMDTWQFS